MKVALVAICLSLLNACSYFMSVEPPPRDDWPQYAPQQFSNCTNHRQFFAMDLATLAGGAYAALPYMIAGTTLGFVVVIPVAVYGASAAYGHSVANDCRDFNYDRSLQHAPSGSE